LNYLAHEKGYKTPPTEASTGRVEGDDMIPHHALGDARRQVIYVCEMWKCINKVMVLI
jgi:hypothetical protein